MSDESSGFWRLQHEHLSAALARTDLTGEQLRVFLALADLTRGYGHERDTVSLSQIAHHAGLYAVARDGARMPDCPHVARALKHLEAVGLYGSAPSRGQSVERWVIWPPPAAPTATLGTTATGGSSATATLGTGTTAKATATGGKHQDTKKDKTRKTSAASPRSEPSPYKQFVDAFTEAWRGKYHEAYPFAGGKDGTAAAAIWKAVGQDLDKARRVIGRYLVCGEPFFTGHPLAKLRSDLPRFLPEPQATSREFSTARYGQE